MQPANVINLQLVLQTIISAIAGVIGNCTTIPAMNFTDCVQFHNQSVVKRLKLIGQIQFFITK